MYICEKHRRLSTLIKAFSFAAENRLPMTDDEFNLLLKAADYIDPYKMADTLKEIDNVNIIVMQQENPFDSEYFSGDRYFAEGAQSNQSAALLWSSDGNDILAIIFYDREYDFYVVEYGIADDVPPELIVKNPERNLCRGIVDRPTLAGRFTNGIIIQA